MDYILLLALVIFILLVCGPLAILFEVLDTVFQKLAPFWRYLGLAALAIIVELYVYALVSAKDHKEFLTKSVKEILIAIYAAVVIIGPFVALGAFLIFLFEWGSR